MCTKKNPKTNKKTPKTIKQTQRFTSYLGPMNHDISNANQIADVSLMKFPIHFSFSLLHRTKPNTTSALTSFQKLLPAHDYLVPQTSLFSLCSPAIQITTPHSKFQDIQATKGGK